MADANGTPQDGKELFRELLRQFPTAKSEDYLKNGRWLTDMLVMDTELIVAHRRESGAPEPPPIEEIELPPELKTSAASSRSVYSPAAKPGPTGPTAGAAKPSVGGTIKPLAPSTGTAPLKPASLLNSGPPRPLPSTASSGVASGPQSELRMIATFVAKWQLDPTRTKLLLARLTPPRRKAVIDNFKITASNGVAPTAALEKYIQEHESSVGVTSSRPLPKPAGVPKPAGMSGPVKRPLSSISSASAADDAKRPRAGVGAARPTSGIATAKAAGVGAKPGDLIKNLLGGL